MEMNMLPWVILVIAVAVVIRFTIEAILRRFNIQRVEPDPPHGLQTLGMQIDQWARRRREQVANRPTESRTRRTDGGRTDAAPRAGREHDRDDTTS